MKKSDKFSSTVKEGCKVKSKNFILHYYKLDTVCNSEIGFVVSKAVGNAVVRNKVKRRLKHLSGDIIENFPERMFFVLKAFPNSYSIKWKDLQTEFEAVIHKIAKN